MKQDILEQLVDDYLQSKGYFTQHNMKFRPRADHPDFIRQQDSNHSDIDVIGFHPKLSGSDHVWVVSCKSWQSGFDVRAKLSEITENKVRSGRESWRFFRELVQPKWSEAFCAAIQSLTGSTEFTYFTAVTRIRGDPSLWENREPFRAALRGNPVRLLDLERMTRDLLLGMGTAVVPSQLGRTIQLLRASGATVSWPGDASQEERA
jgi:hypothetical protein